MIMENNKETYMENSKELTEVEVNLYDNCGEDKYACHNDCIIPFTSLLSRSL